ncbi:malonyl-CoA synthase [Skermanella sp. TT6]|uniref:Malonyl-CoA synthase n=1 Tax=Skermanella cutis TaxID=2775420 RepID=A0ABX7B6N3_9PROT|nr:malonyl-CoA synthase [Skermanella sp. TT6]QQP90041.1 malonyl-CoA synthase [Skermanella sp. TT6]
MSDNLYDLFQSRFPADLSSPFIETDPFINKDRGRIYSYADLHETSGRYARLLTDLGVRKGDRVAVQVEKSPEAIFLYLACLRAGAAYLPLNTAYTKAEVAYFVGDAEPAVVVCRPESEPVIAEVAAKAGVGHVLTLGQSGDGSLPERARGLDPDYATVPAEPGDLAAILYTSGTTGRSKGAMMSHRNLGSNAQALHRIWGWKPGDVLLHALPIFHTHGLFVATNCVLLNGSGMLFLPRFDLDRVVELLPRATVFMGVPTFYTRLLSDPRMTPDLCRSMRLFISGSAPLLADTHREFQERTGHPILERYGMTETGMLTSNPLDGDRVPGTVGFPLPGVELRVVDEKTGEPLGTDGIGIIEVRGPNVFGGYWRMPEKTRSEFRPDGFFITGDVGKIDGRGYVHIVGRAKDLIISGGFNVYPKEVESVIDAIDGIVESAVVGVPHPDFGEAVVAVAMRRPGRDDVTVDRVAAVCKEELANYKVPKRIFFIDELPRNAMGKVQKNLLRDEHKALFA